MNLNSVEYRNVTAFSSTNIDPKSKDSDQDKRENTRLAGRRLNDIGTSHQSAADFEHAGVGIVVKNSLLNSLEDIKQVNG